VNLHDYALFAERSYTDAPTIGASDSASRMHVYHTDAGDVHVFRGTDDVQSVFADANIAVVDVRGLGKVHAGFYNALAPILPAALALPHPVAVVGHSLGAAMAILYAGVLALLGDVVPVYAFEPPRLCADTTLALLFQARRVGWYACRNGRDLVTQVPPELSLPGPLTLIGHASLSFDNIIDHGICRVAAALA
jgi:triacylglycerol lipase